jgi:hypothetical protein
MLKSIILIYIAICLFNLIKERIKSMKNFILIAISGAFLTGCANPLFEPSKSLADAALPEYTEYVKVDSKLTDAQKNRRIQAVENYKLMLDKYIEIEGK